MNDSQPAGASKIFKSGKELASAITADELSTEQIPVAIDQLSLKEAKQSAILLGRVEVTMMQA